MPMHTDGNPGDGPALAIFLRKSEGSRGNDRMAMKEARENLGLAIKEFKKAKGDSVDEFMAMMDMAKDLREMEGTE